LKKTKPTEETLQKMREDVCGWAEAVLADERTVFLDLETTGLPSDEENVEIVQFCLTNSKGRPLLSVMINPEGEIPEAASNCHGILKEHLVSSPSFFEIYPVIAKLLEDKIVVTYNADFDWKVLSLLFKRYGLPKLKPAEVQCAMDQYAVWNGEWSPKKGEFKWQKLPNLSGRMAHDALVDCENLALLVAKMAQFPGERSNVSEEEIDINF
jgi:DNA polymerase-3 subunit epsilon